MRATPDAIHVAGLLSSASGIGNSARLCIDELAAGGFDVATTDVASAYGVNDGIPYRHGEGASPSRLSLFHLNPPMLLVGVLCAGLRRYYRSLNVGYWAWELETLPRDWIDALNYVDAILVPSEFCRATIARHTDKPVRVLPHPLGQSGTPRRHRPSHEMFHVLAIANFGSSFHRKNPAGAIEAFRLAFGSDPSARLTVKTSDGHRHPGDLACLRAAVAGASNIEIVDHVMSDAGMNDLYSSADVYLSLHRSEGYGLTLAEAMLRETPVVATAWSGNMDFCAADTTHLVGYDLVECRDPHPAYAQVEGAQWAAPRTDEAAWHLRHIRQFPAVAANKAAAARKRLVARSRCSSYPTALRELLAAVRARP